MSTTKRNRSLISTSLTATLLVTLAIAARGLSGARSSDGTAKTSAFERARSRSIREELTASRAVLRDGRTLVTGGWTGGQALSRAQIFAVDGAVTPVSPMQTARAGHASVTLRAGRVPVTCGTTADGPT